MVFAAFAGRLFLKKFHELPQVHSYPLSLVVTFFQFLLSNFHYQLPVTNYEFLFYFAILASLREKSGFLYLSVVNPPSLDLIGSTRICWACSVRIAMTVSLKR